MNNAIILCVAAYFAGALPVGLVVARVWKGIDVRDHGSGNIGATNVFRVVGPIAGTIVFVVDVLKGLWPPLVAVCIGANSWWQIAAAMSAIIGHNFSIFIGFKGGKGISTSLGALFGISWKVGLSAWTLWGILLAATHYVSVGSIAASISLVPLTMIFYPGDTARLTFAAVAGLFSLYRHRANIVRLKNGTESKFGKKKESDIASN
ncbi:MAG: glycerol-3-phosphate 1-O-acyltransferase PlsY [Chthonomonadales bacterium]